MIDAGTIIKREIIVLTDRDIYDMPRHELDALNQLARMTPRDCDAYIERTPISYDQRIVFVPRVPVITELA